MNTAYEADGLSFTVGLVAADPQGDPLPVLGFVEARARQWGFGGDGIEGTAIAAGEDVDVSFAAFALRPGTWEVQVRAGATEATARTVYQDLWRIIDSIAPPPAE